MPAPFTLYGHWRSGNVYKAALMLALSGARYDYKHIDLAAGATRTPEFWAINPFGELPVLRHGGETVTQTSVILPYLAQVTGRFGGRDDAETRRIREWLSWETGRLTAGIAPARFARLVQKADPTILAFLQARAKDALGSLERLLTGTFMLGERATVADISACAYTFLVGDAGLDIKDWPRTAAWLDRIRALPGFKPQAELLPHADTPAA